MGSLENQLLQLQILKVEQVDSTVRLATIYKRLNLTYIGLLLTAEELANTIGPGFELEE